MACVDEKDIRMDNADCAYRLVTPTEREVDGQYIFSYRMQGCIHCKDPACFDICPCACFDIRENGLVLLDSAKCSGCGLCAQACMLKAIVIQDGVARKCDGCIDRLEAGMRPACERICPTGALSFKVK